MPQTPRTAARPRPAAVLRAAGAGLLLGLALSAWGAEGTAQDAGAGLYARHCAECHGATGAGDGPRARRLLATPADLRGLAGRLDRELLVERIALGGKVMPGFADVLDPAAQQAIARYVLSWPEAP